MPAGIECENERMGEKYHFEHFGTFALYCNIPA